MQCANCNGEVGLLIKVRKNGWDGEVCGACLMTMIAEEKEVSKAEEKTKEPVPIEGGDADLVREMVLNDIGAVPMYGAPQYHSDSRLQMKEMYPDLWLKSQLTGNPVRPDEEEDNLIRAAVGMVTEKAPIMREYATGKVHFEDMEHLIGRMGDYYGPTFQFELKRCEEREKDMKARPMLCEACGGLDWARVSKCEKCHHTGTKPEFIPTFHGDMGEQPMLANRDVEALNEMDKSQNDGINSEKFWEDTRNFLKGNRPSDEKDDSQKLMETRIHKYEKEVEEE